MEHRSHSFVLASISIQRKGVHTSLTFQLCFLPLGFPKSYLVFIVICEFYFIVLCLPSFIYYMHKHKKIIKKSKNITRNYPSFCRFHTFKYIWVDLLWKIVQFNIHGNLRINMILPINNVIFLRITWSNLCLTIMWYFQNASRSLEQYSPPFSFLFSFQLSQHRS